MNTKKRILLLTDNNQLSACLINDLIHSGFEVEVFCLGGYFNLKGLNIPQHRYSNSTYRKLKDFDYYIFCSGFENILNIEKDFTKFIQNQHMSRAKCMAIIPFEAKSLHKLKINKNAMLIYAGDLLGNSGNYNSNVFISKLIKESLTKHSLTLPVGELFYPTGVEDFSEYIVKLIKVTQEWGKKIFVHGGHTTSRNFTRLIYQFNNNLNIIYDLKAPGRQIPKNITQHIIKTNLTNTLLKIYGNKSNKLNTAEPTNNTLSLPARTTSSIVMNLKKLKFFTHLTSKYRTPGKINHTKEAVKGINLKKVIFLTVKKIMLVMSLFFALPIFTLFLSLFFVALAYLSLRMDSQTNVHRSLNAAKYTFAATEFESGILMNIPLAGKFYDETGYIGYLGKNSIDMYQTFEVITLELEEIFNTLFASGGYDLKSKSIKISGLLNFVSRQTYLMQVESEYLAKSGVYAARVATNIINFAKIYNYVDNASVIASNLPEILADGMSNNYLILFQNSMELRPTGGFIGSYGLATIGNGKLNGLVVNDVYTADGQLNGHVEPPTPIRKYLGEANWWLRDSNWDPDFYVSAQRAEWFLAKEMGDKVEGTIAIDLELVKRLLSITGPIFLPDYNITINSNNLYEITQKEAEKDFFPGSRKKASFLTALTRAIMGKMAGLSRKQKIEMAKVVYNSLEERHIQVYAHNIHVQKSLENLGWAGRIPSYKCGGNCYADFVGSIEANLGVNKSNFYIKREMGLYVNMDDVISKTLITKISNNSSSELGPSGIYKSYIRYLLPSNSENIKVWRIKDNREILMETDVFNTEGYKEVGTYIEINSGEIMDLRISWNNRLENLNSIDSYGLYIRKQAGTINDPIKIKIYTKRKVVEAKPSANLTEPGVYTYNTTLSKDFFSRLLFAE